MSNFVTLNHLQRVRILYKTILKLHRGLPTELKHVGDDYVKKEFKLHKNCNVAEAINFMMEWTKYAMSLSEQLGLRGKPIGKLGSKLNLTDLNKFRDDQILQLYKLVKTIKNIELK